MSTLEKTEIFNTTNLSAKWGILGGIGMAFTLLLFQISGNDYSPSLKLVNYIFLLVAVTVCLSVLKKKYSGDFFVKGLSTGIKLGLIAGVFLAAVNVILYLISPELAFSKYSLIPDSPMDMFFISAVLFFESFVFGGIMTFITLQLLKNSPRN